MQLSKESMAKAKKDFALHLALIMREGVGKTEACVVAYAEGSDGLDARLPSPPLLALAKG